MTLELLDQLTVDEGCELFPYRCPTGYWSIGVGRNLESRGLTFGEQQAFFGKSMSNEQAIEALHHRGITKDEAQQMLERDMFSTFDALIKRIPYLPHDDVRYSVLVNMAFQMGVNGLMKFKKTIKYFNAKDYKACSVEMLDSSWAKQTPNRANRLSQQMITGKWF